MKNFIRSLYDSIINEKKAKAEFEIAKQLWSAEYRYESFDYILTMVRAGKIYELGLEKRT